MTIKDLALSSMFSFLFPLGNRVIFSHLETLTSFGIFPPFSLLLTIVLSSRSDFPVCSDGPVNLAMLNLRNMGMVLESTLTSIVSFSSRSTSITRPDVDFLSFHQKMMQHFFCFHSLFASLVYAWTCVYKCVRERIKGRED